MSVRMDRHFYRSVTFMLLLSLAGWSALGLGAFYYYTHKSLPQTRGTARPAGLQKPGLIVRDKLGIPHCYAGNRDDLFYLAGYAQAQDRLFQMDLLRRTAAGRVAEWKGKEATGQDRLARAIGFKAMAEDYYKELPPDSRAVLESFAAGVNAYALSGAQSLPVEYGALKAKFEPWKAEDSLAVVLLSVSEYIQLSILDGGSHPEKDYSAFHFAKLPEQTDPADYQALVRNTPRLPLYNDNKWIFGNNGQLAYQSLQSGFSLPSPHYLISLSAPGIEAAGVSFPGFPMILSGISGGALFSVTPVITPSKKGDAIRELIWTPPVGRGFWLVWSSYPRKPAAGTPGTTKIDLFGLMDRPFRARGVWSLAQATSTVISRHLDDETINRAWIQVKDWDGEMSVDSAAPLIYSETMRQAMAMRKLGDEGALMTLLLSDTPGVFDDPRTPRTEGRDDFLLAAFRAALEELSKKHGPRMTQWKWGDAHRLKLRHPLGDEHLGTVLRYFTLVRPSPPMPGGRDTIWNGYYNWDGDYSMTAGTSLFLVMNLAKPDELCVAYAGGQSGQPFSPHYADLLQYWLAGECVPVALNRARVEQGAESVLRLMPPGGKIQ